MTVCRIVKAPALLALFGVIFVAVVRYAAVAETQVSAFTDGRDGKTYKTIVIGGKTWMAENLNIKTDNPYDSWCYDNDESNCEKYGRLYNWSAAKTACPAGWHLPSREEWGDLAKAAGGTDKYGTAGKAGRNLKAKSGWKNSYNNRYWFNVGTDDYGFSALPGGYRCGYRCGNYFSSGNFDDAGNGGYWWTATEANGGVYGRDMYYDDGRINENYVDKGYGFSVRCLGN
jgi:uncharacterized protein (TIGR02145 family)